MCLLASLSIPRVAIRLISPNDLTVQITVCVKALNATTDHRIDHKRQHTHIHTHTYAITSSHSVHYVIQSASVRFPGDDGQLPPAVAATPTQSYVVYTYAYMCWVYMHVSVQVYLYVRAAHYLLSIYLYFYASLSFVVVLLKHSMYCVVITFYWGVGPVYRRCRGVTFT